MSQPNVACTVSELIAHLRAFPPETRCVFSKYSDVAPLELEGIKFCGAATARVYLRRDQYFVLHDSERVDTTPQRAEELRSLDYQTVVWFPGN